ncbi:MAG: hypothetical protein HDT33_02750 [Clostridiales bacterium]|nr:hypothetical protein [Clostridiales bacterium]
MESKKPAGLERFQARPRQDQIEYDLRKEIIDLGGVPDPMDRHAVYQGVGIGAYPGRHAGKLGCAEAKKLHDEYQSRILVSGEPDSCPLFQDIWRRLWHGKLCLFPCLEVGQVRGDTMNSISTTLNELFRSQLGDLVEPELGFKGWGKVTTIWLYARHRNLYGDVLAACPGAEEFLRAAYSVGNLTPVPIGCNSPRGLGSTRDYWDLALWCAFHWYQDRSTRRDRYLALLLGCPEDSKEVRQYHRWLSAFGSWEAFVETCFMQPFLAADGSPKPLWEGHIRAFEAFAANDIPGKGSAHILPAGEQISAYFTNAAAAIRARSALIVDALDEAENRRAAPLRSTNTVCSELPTCRRSERTKCIAIPICSKKNHLRRNRSRWTMIRITTGPGAPASTNRGSCTPSAPASPSLPAWRSILR